MSKQALGENDAAASAMRVADQIMENNLRKIEDGDLGFAWADWVISELARREAKRVLDATSVDARQ